ncbi:restriction endonuclease [bacterium]|nr:restriction endonuclease [bacterium]
MQIKGIYSFADGKDKVYEKYPELLEEIKDVISLVDAEKCFTKESKEKTMMGKMLYSPDMLNKEFKKYFTEHGWASDVRQKCDYPTQFYVNNYNPENPSRGAFRGMDFVKDKLGVEVQFGKYSFMVYNVCAKMTIFKNLGHINMGVEIVPVKELAKKMSSGVSYFEQFVWDLEERGISNIDIPVLIIGIGL